MWNDRGFMFFVVVFIVSCLFTIGSSDRESCPFHVCTPERLGCPSSKLLRNDQGCFLCKCEESVAPSRPCQLHGCTVELLECTSSRLKQSAEGCTLCECDDIGTVTTLRIGIDLNETKTTRSPFNSHLPIAPDVELSDTAFVPILSAPTSTPFASCPALACTADLLGCNRLGTNPLTGCPLCACSGNPSISGLALKNHVAGGEGLTLGAGDQLDLNPGGEYDEEEDPCPHPTEILHGDGMQQGRNQLDSTDRDVAKYRLSIGKLKQGFHPGKKYKISLRAHERADPFRAFLFDVQPASLPGPDGVSVELGSGNNSGGEACREAGFFSDTGNGSLEVRPVPKCPNAAVAGDDRTNKTYTMVEWIAPACGCVHIRVAVVDHTDRFGYLDPSLTPPADRGEPPPPSGKVNRALLRAVCARSSSTDPTVAKKKNYSGNSRRVSWIVTDCCLAALDSSKRSAMTSSRLTTRCERDSILYSTREYFRFSVIRKTCRKAFKSCCVMTPQIKIGDEAEGDDSPKSRRPSNGNRMRKKNKGKKNRRKNGKSRGKMMSGASDKRTNQAPKSGMKKNLSGSGRESKKRRQNKNKTRKWRRNKRKNRGRKGSEGGRKNKHRNRDKVRA